MCVSTECAHAASYMCICCMFTFIYAMTRASRFLGDVLVHLVSVRTRNLLSTRCIPTLASTRNTHTHTQTYEGRCALVVVIIQRPASQPARQLASTNIRIQYTCCARVVDFLSFGVVDVVFACRAFPRIMHNVVFCPKTHVANHRQCITYT